ncbi:uncharacterized protein NPIL_509721 [Nephila pilipes]|uniref:Uncharacterized protein n=1 Tax=Nephila pilipes TaxID=299642 RepID=A0A8X6N5R8_NEPPI|nr:uncharacterized protein NPIL_509721 [Nephila pilipes]
MLLILQIHGEFEPDVTVLKIQFCSFNIMFIIHYSNISWLFNSMSFCLSAVYIGSSYWRSSKQTNSVLKSSGGVRKGTSEQEMEVIRSAFAYSTTKLIMWEFLKICSVSCLPQEGRVLSENSSCATVYDLYHFYCLRKTLFDFQASGIKKYVPLQISEKFCLQLQLSIINGITVIAFSILYSISVLICCILIRFLKQKLMSIFGFSKKLRGKEKRSFWKDCQKKLLQPGTKKPWQELYFTTKIEPFNKNNKITRKSYQFSEENAPVRPLLLNEDNKRITEEKQNNKNASRTSLKVADTIKSDATEICYSMPETKRMSKSDEERSSQMSYTEASTYVCFDSEESSNESDSDLLHN